MPTPLLATGIMLNVIAVILAAGIPLTSLGQTPVAADAPSVTSAPVAAAPVPTLTPEQRREFAVLQQALMGDAEYKAAVKRAIEAQRAADNLFFAKMARAAKPELQPYIKFLQQSRTSAGSQAP